MLKIPATADGLISQIAPGGQVVVRDEEWLVRAVQQTPADGILVHCLGISTLVRDTESSFFTNLDRVEPLRATETELVVDDTPGFRRSRLYLEAVLRKTPVPATDTGLTVAHRQLLKKLTYQEKAVHKALSSLRPRLLIGDGVGLGKTLEVGMILSELIRRGRGEKILVVTPRHILEQFQHELWTRFAIPLVRLESEGIQRLRRTIPANRNPFTVYRRAIISIDTLKDPGKYQHHLEGMRWDAVVIDECHAVSNQATLKHKLARVLAPRTDALLLTSATPHNGDPESFAELIRLLDPTAVVDPKDLTGSDIDHLYVRRHKSHPDVAPELGSDWADRKDPRAIGIAASAPENDLFAELAEVWTHPDKGATPVAGRGRSLFPWTLFKAALSSHHALLETVEARRKNLAKRAADAGQLLDPAVQAEDDALVSLAQRCEAIDDTTASKLTTLVDNLTDIGVGPKSDTRVVVFSERIATLDWLARTVPGRLGMKDDQVRVLHGGMADLRQMDEIEEFGLAQSPVRLLFTGDMASEGVNLHRECHHLIHFDLPWSLITIEQRNGRIDRYGQRHAPDIRALVLTPDHDTCTGDVHVLNRLLEREHEAHKAFGESGSLLGIYDAELETDEVMKILADGTDLDTTIEHKAEDRRTKGPSILDLFKPSVEDEVPFSEVPTLFDSDLAFANEALRAAFPDPERTLEIRTEEADPELISLRPPDDLVRRLATLPQSYLREQDIVQRLRLTGDRHRAELQLDLARADTDSIWPQVGHLSPMHPFLDWLADKALVAVGRNQAPVLVANVDSPVFCVQGQYANGRGQPQLVEWLAVTPERNHETSELFDVLSAAGVNAAMANPGRPIDVDALAKHLPDVVDAARAELDRRRVDHDAHIEDLLAEPRQRLTDWSKRSMNMAYQIGARDDPRRNRLQRHVREVSADTERLIDSLRTTGQPMLRVLAVLVGSGHS